MLYDPYLLDILIKERQQELLQQSRIISQLRNINGSEPRGRIYLDRISSRFKSLISPDATRMDRAARSEDCMPAPECQVC